MKCISQSVRVVAILIKYFEISSLKIDNGRCGNGFCLKFVFEIWSMLFQG